MSSLSLSRPASRWAGALTALGLLSVAAAGCDDNSVTCDSSGHCQVCNSLGCQPATSGGGGGAGGSASNTTGTGGATTTTTGTGGTGGTAPCDPTQATCPCDANGKCTGGLTCVSGLCINGCNFTYQCPSGEICDNGACTPGCSTAADCGAGYACTKGVCVLDPTNPACSGTSPCPSGQVCASGVCAAGCSTNGDCPAGQVCDGASHACIPDPSVEPVCSATKACPSPQMCEPDGYCHYPCASLSDCQHIDNRFVACNQGFCQTQDEVSPECSLSMPCPPGKDCISSKCQ